MKGAAERPSGASATSEPRPGREPEGASFTPSRVADRRGRPPLLLLGFVAALGGVVLTAVVGQTPRYTAPIPPVGGGSPNPAAIGASQLPDPTGTPLPVGPRRSPGAAATPAPILTTGPGPIELQVRRHPETMFVHGDVFADRVTWVFVSLMDDTGRVAGWASVSVPGAAGPGVGTGPTLRFDVELALPARTSAERLWILATAYDSAGQLITSKRLEVGPDGAGGSIGRG